MLRIRWATLLSDELIALIFRVVVVFQFACAVELKIEELMAVGSTVPNAKSTQTLLISHEEIGVFLHRSIIVSCVNYKFKRDVMRV